MNVFFLNYCSNEYTGTFSAASGSSGFLSGWHFKANWKLKNINYTNTCSNWASENVYNPYNIQNTVKYGSNHRAPPLQQQQQQQHFMTRYTFFTISYIFNTQIHLAW